MSTVKLSFDVINKVVSPVCVVNPHFYREPVSFSIDSRAINANEGFIAIKGPRFDGHDFIKDVYSKGSRLVFTVKPLLNTGSKLCDFVVNDTVKAMADIAKHVKGIKNPITAAVTGSVGKTTVKDMLAYLTSVRYSVCFNAGTENNIYGVCKTIFKIKDERVLIVELGTNAKGEIKNLTEIVSPDIAVITFIKPAHLEGLENINGVFREKTDVLNGKKTVGVLNGDDPMLRRVRRRKIIWFGKNKSNDVRASLKKYDCKESVFTVNGRYILRVKQAPLYVYNALAALAAADVMGIKVKEGVDILSDFNRFAPMRMERSEKKNFTFINDSYNANPYSVKAALDALKRYPGVKIGVFGDMGELGDLSAYYHKNIANDIIKCGFAYVAVVGELTYFLVDELTRRGYNKTSHFSSYDQLTDFIKKRFTGEATVFIKGSRTMEMEKIIHNW